MYFVKLTITSFFNFQINKGGIENDVQVGVENIMLTESVQHIIIHYETLNLSSEANKITASDVLRCLRIGVVSVARSLFPLKHDSICVNSKILSTKICRKLLQPLIRYTD